ncbi:hypothetical protein Aau02nite_63230 [Amorphoplanes auranticolor]|uniref:Uncharacterized protein n=1 Tax=Actinoplanes auranticolor TaxID=47988 RepID=A0A919SPX1_9ACTN|nr:hypothetical protein Aau02nite_63230 [Actinoplanes auranticolor]
MPDTPKCRSSWCAVSACDGSPSGRQTIIDRIVAIGVCTAAAGTAGPVFVVAEVVFLAVVLVGTRRPKRLRGVAAPLCVAVIARVLLGYGRVFWARRGDRPTGYMGRLRVMKRKGSETVRGGAGWCGAAWEGHRAARSPTGPQRGGWTRRTETVRRGNPEGGTEPGGAKCGMR